MVSNNLRQRGAAEAGEVKFAVEQRMGTAVMLLQEVRNWQGGQGVLTADELYTDLDLDTAVAISRDFACDVRESVFSKKYTFVVMFGTVRGSVHLPCDGDVHQDDLCSMLHEMECVIINVRRRHHTSRIVIRCDLNVSLAPSLEGLTGSRIHPNANSASARWRGAVTEWMHSLRLKAVSTFDYDSTTLRTGWDREEKWTHQNSNQGRNIQLDFILVSDNVRGEAFLLRGYDLGSDHRPIDAALRLEHREVWGTVDQNEYSQRGWNTKTEETKLIFMKGVAKDLCWMNDEARCKALLSVEEIIYSHAVGDRFGQLGHQTMERTSETENALRISEIH